MSVFCPCCKTQNTNHGTKVFIGALDAYVAQQNKIAKKYKENLIFHDRFLLLDVNVNSFVAQFLLCNISVNRGLFGCKKLQKSYKGKMQTELIRTATKCIDS